MSSLFLAVALAGASASATDPNGQLEKWVRAALAQHPEAQAARLELEAVRGEATGARAWMPPNAQIQYTSDGRADLSLTQMIPGFGKLNSLQAVREAKMEMTRTDSGDRLRKLELAVRESAWMEWMAWEKTHVYAAQETLAVRLSETVRRNLAQAMASGSESWLADAKLRQIRIDANKARAEAMAATAMREAWTGAGDAPLAAGPAQAPDWDDSAMAQASRQRTDVRTMDRDAAMQSAMGEAMAKGLRPDFMVGAMVMQMPDGMPGWGVMAGMSLPFVPWARSMAQGDAAGARARSRAVQSRAQTMARMAKAEVADQASRARSAWTGLRELDSLLAGQDRAVADARARYAQGHEMLTMVMAMQDMVLMTRMEAVMRRGEYELARARLYAAAGTRQTSSPDPANAPAPGQTRTTKDGVE